MRLGADNDIEYSWEFYFRPIVDKIEVVDESLSLCTVIARFT